MRRLIAVYLYFVRFAIAARIICVVSQNSIRFCSRNLSASDWGCCCCCAVHRYSLHPLEIYNFKLYASHVVRLLITIGQKYIKFKIAQSLRLHYAYHGWSLSTAWTYYPQQLCAWRNRAVTPNTNRNWSTTSSHTPRCFVVDRALKGRFESLNKILI